MLKVDEALKELQSKSYRDIQKETAYKWGSRAAASYKMLLSTPQEHKLARWTMSEEYQHEALEHAALIEDGAGTLVQEIYTAIKPFQDAAFKNMEQTFGQASQDEGTV